MQTISESHKGKVQAVESIHGGQAHTHTQTKSRSAVTCKTLQTVSTLQRLQFYFFSSCCYFATHTHLYVCVCVCCVPHVHLQLVGLS